MLGDTQAFLVEHRAGHAQQGAYRQADAGKGFHGDAGPRQDHPDRAQQAQGEAQPLQRRHPLAYQQGRAQGDQDRLQ